MDYQLTQLGEGMLLNMFPLWDWILENAAAFRQASETFSNQQ